MSDTFVKADDLCGRHIGQRVWFSAGNEIVTGVLTYVGVDGHRDPVERVLAVIGDGRDPLEDNGFFLRGDTQVWLTQPPELLPVFSEDSDD